MHTRQQHTRPLCACMRVWTVSRRRRAGAGAQVHSRHRGSGALSAALLATVGTMHWAQAHHAHHLNVPPPPFLPTFSRPRSCSP